MRKATERSLDAWIASLDGSKPSVDTGFATPYEIAKNVLGREPSRSEIDRVAGEIRFKARIGRIEVKRQHRPRMDGHMTLVPTYRILPPKK